MTFRRLSLLLAALLITQGCVTITRLAPDASPPPSSTAQPIETEVAQPTPETTELQTAPATPPPTPPPTPELTPQATETALPSPEPTASAKPTPEPTVNPTPEPTSALGEACRDDTYNLSGYAWDTALEWRFDVGSTPAGYDPAAVLTVIQASFANITDAHNDCGRSDGVSASAVYLGETERDACGSDFAGEFSVVGFGDLPGGTLAQMCPYVNVSGDIFEASIIISRDESWALSLEACRGGEMLEATVTHEVGHAFGLGHVGERQHGRLTMSKLSDGSCNNEEASLGLGDLLGLEALY